MESFRSVPFIRFIPAFIMGIIYAFYLPVNDVVFIVSGLIVFPFCFLLAFRKSTYKKRFFFGIYIQLLFFIGGAMMVSVQCSPDVAEDRTLFIGTIKEHVTRNERQRAEVVLSYSSDGKQFYSGCERIMVYFPPGTPSVKYNDRLVFYGKPEIVPEARNPGEFDWKFYLSVKRIHRQLFLQEGKYILLEPESFSLRRFSEGIRMKLLSYISAGGMEKQESAVVSALVLGYDDEIDLEVMDAFSATGTLHVLSVSGMHVSLIYSVLAFLFRFMEKGRKRRRLRLILLISCIWLYAMITGFSPSVVRSSMMFTVVLLAGTFSRKSNIYNSLFISAFLIFLFIDPLMIFYPGFQLSILAVAGIVYLYPLISKWYLPSNAIMEFVWSILAVSLAAQLGTLPVSLFYFHQFPNYFLLSNLIILPLSTIIIFAGIGLLIISPWNFLAAKLGWIINLITGWMLQFAYVIKYLPYSVSDELVVSLLETLLLYLFILQLVQFLTNRSIVHAYACLLLIICFLSGVILRNSTSRNRDEFVVISSKKDLILGRLTGYCGTIVYSGDEKRVRTLAENYFRARRSVYRHTFIALPSDSKKYLGQSNYYVSDKLVMLGKLPVTLNEKRGIDSTHLVLLKRNNGFPLLLFGRDTLRATKKAIVLPMNQLKRSISLPVSPGRTPFSV